MSTATSPLASQIDEARKHGYNDDEIVGYLGKKRADLAPKFTEAKQSGYASKDILDHLAKAPIPKPAGIIETATKAAVPLLKRTEQMGTDMLKGAVKEVGKQALDFNDVIRSIPVVGRALSSGEPTKEQREAVQPKGLGQKTGAFITDTAEYAIPGAAEEEAATAAARIAGKTGSKFLTKAAEKAVRGLSAGAVSAAQTGSLKEGAKTAVTVGPLSRASAASKIFPKAVDETTQRIAKLAREVPGGIGMLPDEMADKKLSLSRVLQYLASYSMLGGEKLRSLRQEAAGRIAGAINKWKEEALGYRSGPLGSGKVASDAIESARQVFRTEAQKMYSGVDAVSGSVAVPTKTLKQAIAAEADKTAFAKSVGIKELSKPDSDAVKIFSDADSVEENITFDNAQTMRSALADIMRKDGVDPNAKRIAQMAFSNLNQAMETAARKEPGLWKAYQSANNFYRHGMETFENEAVAQLLQKKPEALASSVGKGQVSNALAIRRAMTQYIKYATPEDAKSMQRGFDAFRDQWVRTQLLSSPERGGAAPNLEGLGKKLEDMRGPIQALFRFDPKSRQLLQNLDTLSKASGRMEKLGEHAFARFREVGAAMGGISAGLGLLFGHGGHPVEAAAIGAGTAVAGEVISRSIVHMLYRPKALEKFLATIENAARETATDKIQDKLTQAARMIRVYGQSDQDEESVPAPPPPPNASSPTVGQAPPPPPGPSTTSYKKPN